jgi:hypothetical protein
MLLSQDRPPPGAWRHEGGLPRRRATTADAGELLLLPDLPDQTLLGRQPSAVFFFLFFFFLDLLSKKILLFIFLGFF